MRFRIDESGWINVVSKLVDTEVDTLIHTLTGELSFRGLNPGVDWPDFGCGVLEGEVEGGDGVEECGRGGGVGVGGGGLVVGEVR